jgi:hypothetical protein
MRRHTRIASRLIAVFIGITALGCTREHRTTPLPGQYVRSRVRLIEGGQVLPTPADGPFTASFPSNVEIDDGNAYQVQSTEGELTGKYRMEHDSIFFDRDVGGVTRVAFAGRVLDDTLEVHWLPTSGGGGASGNDIQLRFVRAK